MLESGAVGGELGRKTQLTNLHTDTMENKEVTEKTAIQGKEEPPTKETNVVTEKVDTEEKKDVKKIKETVEEKA